MKIQLQRLREDDKIKLWQRDGNNTDTLTGHKGGVMSVSFHPQKANFSFW